MDAKHVTNLINQVKDPSARQALQALHEHYRDKFNNHTHNANGGQAGSYFTSKPRSDAQTVSGGTAQEF